MEVEVRDTGEFHVPAHIFPSLTDFCTAISAKVDAVVVAVLPVRARFPGPLRLLGE
ncbi:hypothetical protein PUR34_30520 [Streptomyces sp. JV185]|uniref:hypothetical protein n=1 Tax=Streptomyces sp. JV185 TaxID=858638 RepID=UPI002E7713CF|nr:hypothetical protein [Streptomyces sp. JV185]MEE1772384.1 hypothetical protein [Streptomyces sp. JV185]